MKTTLFSLFIAALFVLSGCAARSPQARIPTPPSASKKAPKTSEEKRAEKIEEQREKNERQQAEFRTRLQLRCKNTADDRKVVIYNVAGDTGTLVGRSVYKIRTTNSSMLPVRVTQAALGIYIENLLPGCEVDLIRRLNVYKGDGNNIKFYFEASAETNGVVMKSRSQSYSLSNQDALYDSPKSGDWYIVLQPIVGDPVTFIPRSQ